MLSATRMPPRVLTCHVHVPSSTLISHDSRRTRSPPPPPTMSAAGSSVSSTSAHVVADDGGNLASFYYSPTVPINYTSPATGQTSFAYSTKLQRGGAIQPFGCLLAVNPSAFSIIAYSSNLPYFFNTAGDSAATNLLCTDARRLFATASAAVLTTVAVATTNLSLANPILVHSAKHNKPFHAVLHINSDAQLIIDLEPACGVDHARALGLAARGVSELHSLSGDVGALCDAAVEHVQRITGYDRVMAYKFHADGHGEVVSEIRRADLEPYLGLHYPATDVPLAARKMFLQKRSRLVVNCYLKPVQMVGDERLCLAGSILRAPHPCHARFMANMGSVGSLVMSIVVDNNEGSESVWGLLVCHHTTPRFVPFEIRCAYELLVQAFSVRLNLKLQLASQLAEKKLIKTQNLLCDVLLRDARDLPLGLLNRSPNMMDLLKCDGAAVCHNGKCYVLGRAPNEVQVWDIVEWLLSRDGDANEFIIEGLADAGYRGAVYLDNDVCGVAAARVVSRDFLLWFRCECAREIKWGGAIHHPDVKDDAGIIRPRLSFKVFREMVKNRSLPWETSEVNAIKSFRDIVGDLFQGVKDGHENEMEKMDELSSFANEMVRLIERAGVPIVAVDTHGLINGWNTRAAELTGLSAEEAAGKSLIYELIHEDSRKTLASHLSQALHGIEDKNIELKLRRFDCQQTSYVIIMANSCSSKDCNDNVVGVCFIGQDITGEKALMDKLIHLQGNYEAILHTSNPLMPPLFASDKNTRCSEWNAAMERLTGLTKEEAIGKLLIGEIFGGLFQLNSQDALIKITENLYGAISGKDYERTPFSFIDKNGNHVETLLSATRRTDRDGRVTGCFCFLEPVTPGLLEAIELQKQLKRKTLTRIKEVEVILQEIKNPLNGMLYVHKLLESSVSSYEHRKFLEASAGCERQLKKIIDGLDLESIEGW